MEDGRERRKQWIEFALAVLGATGAVIAYYKEPAPITRLGLIGALGMCLMFGIGILCSHVPKQTASVPREITPEIRRRRRILLLASVIGGLLAGSVIIYLTGFPAAYAVTTLLLMAVVVVPLMLGSFRTNDAAKPGEPAP